jgi:Arc/MetJ family transcription regulator
MRTNIVIDDALMAEALRATGLKTKREAVEAGLRLLARRARQASAAELFGAVEWRGDLDAERSDGARPRRRGRAAVAAAAR